MTETPRIPRESPPHWHGEIVAGLPRDVKEMRKRRRIFIANAAVAVRAVAERIRQRCLWNPISLAFV